MLLTFMFLVHTWGDIRSADMMLHPRVVKQEHGDISDDKGDAVNFNYNFHED